MSKIPEVFAIFEQKLAHVLSFTLREKGQKKAIEELLVYFSGIVERASKAESRIAELEMKIRHNALWQASEDAEERAHLEKLVPDLKKRIADLEELVDELVDSGDNLFDSLNPVAWKHEWLDKWWKLSNLVRKEREE